jgi:hypothetical protein
MCGSFSSNFGFRVCGRPLGNYQKVREEWPVIQALMRQATEAGMSKQI